MGTAIGILLVAGTIASFVAINIRARRMSPGQSNSAAGWTIDRRDHGEDSMGGDHHGGGHHGGGHFGGDPGGGHFGGGHHD